MSLAIVLAEAEHKEEADYSGCVPSPPLVPPAPPLPPGGLSVRKVWRKSQDSGCGSFGDDSYFDDLPGCNVSDDEFNENFAVSRPSSRGSSSPPSEEEPPVFTFVCGGVWATYVRGIPVPPSPPPVQFHLPRFVDQRRQSNDSEVVPRVRRDLFRRSVSLDSDISYDRVVYYYSLAERGTSDVQTEAGTCIVCYDETLAFTKRLCCQQIVCQSCLGRIIHTRLNDGLIEFPCPNPECSDPIGRTEVLGHLNQEDKVRFERLRVNAESDKSRKTCPHCSHITEHHLPVRKVRRLREEEVKVQCENCRIEWCFKCHAPWHQGLTCKEFMKGNRQFQKWTKDRPNGVANCQKCPTCRVFIQRSTGCDHMTCNRCKTHFCYKCGGRFIDIPGFGDHYERMSVFGCKYSYLPDEPAKRRAVRGGYFGAKMAMLTGYPVLFVAGVALVIVVGAVTLPIYGGYRLYKFKKNTNRIRRQRRRH